MKTKKCYEHHTKCLKNYCEKEPKGSECGAPIKTEKEAIEFLLNHFCHGGEVMTKLESFIAVVLVLLGCFIAGVQAQKYIERVTGDNYSDGYANGVEAGNGEER